MAKAVGAASIEQKHEEKHEDMYEVDCVEPIEINGKQYIGRVKANLELAEVLNEMLNKKIQADIKVFAGKQYLIDRVSGTRIVRKIVGEVK